MDKRLHTSVYDAVGMQERQCGKYRMKAQSSHILLHLPYRVQLLAEVTTVSAANKPDTTGDKIQAIKQRLSKR